MPVPSLYPPQGSAVMCLGPDALIPGSANCSELFGEREENRIDEWGELADHEAGTFQIEQQRFFPAGSGAKYACPITSPPAPRANRSRPKRKPAFVLNAESRSTHRTIPLVV